MLAYSSVSQKSGVLWLGFMLSAHKAKIKGPASLRTGLETYRKPCFQAHSCWQNSFPYNCRTYIRVSLLIFSWGQLSAAGSSSCSLPFGHPLSKFATFGVLEPLVFPSLTSWRNSLLLESAGPPRESFCLQTNSIV